jgi:putative spermidine/putrescine transport system substrate-binding protein
MSTRLIALLGMLLVVGNAVASDLTVVSSGRLNQNLRTKAYFGPFTKSTGINVRSFSYDGQLDTLREYAGSGNTRWDIVEVETAELLHGCEEGLFEKIDATKIDHTKDLIPGAMSECGVGTYVSAMIISWNPETVKGGIRSWTDFWDIKKYPGTRGLPRNAKYTLEIALLADGVAPADIYKVLATQEGVDRAFNKLDELKPYVKWWEAAAQAPLWLNSGQLDMTAAYSLWIDAAQNNRGWNFPMNWNGSLYDISSWAIVKGAPHPEEAYRFISFASKPENQKIFSDNIVYGPTNMKTLKLIGAKRANQLPRWGANLKNGTAIDGLFWLAHGEELEKRFQSWAPPINRPQMDDEHDSDDQSRH